MSDHSLLKYKLYNGSKNLKCLHSMALRTVFVCRLLVVTEQFNTVLLFCTICSTCAIIILKET